MASSSSEVTGPTSVDPQTVLLVFPWQEDGSGKNMDSLFQCLMKDYLGVNVTGQDNPEYSAAGGLNDPRSAWKVGSYQLDHAGSLRLQ